ncbi:MAG: glycine oxidase [Bacteroidia bacterium]|jgi:glycine oxidase
MNNTVFDYLIIGQGIAGSVLAMSILEEGKTCYVMDSRSPNTSSEIAAGIMNPITGKRMTLSWKADVFFPTAKSFYSRMEDKLNNSFLHKLPVHRIFSSVGEQNDWAAKWTHTKYKNFIQPDAINSYSNENILTPNGSMKVDGGGRLSTSKFLSAVRNYLKVDSCFEERDVSIAEVEYDNDSLRIGGIVAKSIVFCTGYDPINWGFLPFTPMKGEILELESEALPNDSILVGGCFLSPIQEHKFYAGATYDWKHTDLIKTTEAKSEILKKVSGFTQGTLKVVNHKVGIRPAVKDRRPMLGSHPDKPNTYLFSGLGSKGVSMAPHLAKCLLNYMSDNTPLDLEMDLNRFVS